MRDLFRVWELGFIGGGGSIRELTYRGIGRERWCRWTERKKSAERERRRRQQQEGAEVREYYNT